MCILLHRMEFHLWKYPIRIVYSCVSAPDSIKTQDVSEASVGQVFPPKWFQGRRFLYGGTDNNILPSYCCGTASDENVYAYWVVPIYSGLGGSPYGGIKN